MKYLFTIAIIALTISNTFSQLSKTERKALRAELKEMMSDLEAYKKRKDRAAEELSSKEAEIKKLRDDVATVETQKVELEQQVAKLSSDLAAAKTEKEKMKEEMVPDMTKTPKETVFKVQIGLYQKLDVTASMNPPKYVGYEMVNDMKRYVVSYFKSEDEAEQFAKDVRKLGIKDAFVAKYENGERVFEWQKNPKFRNRKAPSSLNEALQKGK